MTCCIFFILFYLFNNLVLFLKKKLIFLGVYHLQTKYDLIQTLYW